VVRKTPSLYVVYGVFMKILGFNAWAAKNSQRFVWFRNSYIDLFVGKKLFNKTVGFISGLALITTAQFLYYARASMLDVTSTFFLVLSLGEIGNIISLSLVFGGFLS